MTSPLAHGYPDFGRFVATADKVLENINDGLANGFPIHGRYFVGDVPRLGIIASLSIDNAQFSVEFWSAKSGGTQMGGVAFSIRAGSKVDTTIPVVGPWVDVTVTPNGANPTYDLILFTNHSPAFNMVTAHTGNLLITVGQNINAATTLDVTTSRVWPGEAYWSLLTLSVNWELRIEAFTYTATATRMENLTGAAAGNFRGPLFLPASNVRARLINNDAVARFFHFCLMARPIEPGR